MKFFSLIIMVITFAHSAAAKSIKVDCEDFQEALIKQEKAYEDVQEISEKFVQFYKKTAKEQDKKLLLMFRSTDEIYRNTNELLEDLYGDCEIDQ